MQLIVLLSICTIASAVKEGWIDPHDMNMKTKHKLKRSMSDAVKIVHEKKEIDNNSTSKVEESVSLIFLKRAISLILTSANPEEDNPELYKGSYTFRSGTDEHKFLKEFSLKNGISADDIRRLDTILSAIFANQYDNSFININFSKEQVFTAVYRLDVLIVFAGTVILYIMYHLLKHNYGFFYILSYFIFLILIIDFGLRYKILYEAAEEHNMNLIYSADCDVHKMGWGDYLKFMISSRDCERKIVTPLDVSLNQLKSIIIIPLESLGTGMGKFGKELWEKLPFPWNILIFPIMLVFTIGMVFMFTIALRNIGFELDVMRLFRLKVGNQHDNSNKISGKTLDKLLEIATHRKMIEDSKSSPEGRNRTKNKNNKNKSHPQRTDKTPTEPKNKPSISKDMTKNKSKKEIENEKPVEDIPIKNSENSTVKQSTSDMKKDL